MASKDPMDVNIRYVKKEELPEMLRVMYKVFPNADIKVRGYDGIIVADNSNDFIGFIHYSENEKAVFIKGIGVEPAYRGMGIGSLLLKKLLAIFEKKSKSIYLKVKMMNPALSLYMRHGFFLSRFGNVHLVVKKQNN